MEQFFKLKHERIINSIFSDITFIASYGIEAGYEIQEKKERMWQVYDVSYINAKIKELEDEKGRFIYSHAISIREKLKELIEYREKLEQQPIDYSSTELANCISIISNSNIDFISDQDLSLTLIDKPRTLAYLISLNPNPNFKLDGLKKVYDYTDIINNCITIANFIANDPVNHYTSASDIATKLVELAKLLKLDVNVPTSDNFMEMKVNNIKKYMNF